MRSPLNILRALRGLSENTPDSESAIKKTPVHHLPLTLSRDRFIGERVIFQLDNEALSFAISKHGIGIPALRDFGKVFLPLKNATEEQRLTILRREIPLLLDGANLRHPEFGLCLSSVKSVVRTFELPKMSEDELRNAVYYAGQKKTPFPLDDSYWNYRVTDTIPGSDGDKVVILLIAVAKTHVDTLREFFSEFGIEFSFIYQDIEVLGEALRCIQEFNSKTGYGLINVRSTRTDISLYQGSRLRFLHRGSTGSRTLTPPGRSSANLAEIFPKLLDRFAESLATEVQNALDYYGAQNSVNELQKVFIYGDMTFNDELIERFTDQFGVEFCRFPEFPESLIALKCDQPRELLPTTLPVVSVVCSGRQFTDLSPVEVIADRQQKRFRKTMLQSAAAFLLMFGLLWHQSISDLNSAESTRNALAEQVVQFERSPAYAAYRILQQEISRQERILSTLGGEPTERYLTLKELTTLTPSQIIVTYFEYYPGATGQPSHLGGVVTSQNEAPEVILAEYVSRLNSSPLFTDVELVRHNKDIINGTRKVTFTLDLGGRL